MKTFIATAITVIAISTSVAQADILVDPAHTQVMTEEATTLYDTVVDTASDAVDYVVDTAGTATDYVVDTSISVTETVTDYATTGWTFVKGLF